MKDDETDEKHRFPGLVASRDIQYRNAAGQAQSVTWNKRFNCNKKSTDSLLNNIKGKPATETQYSMSEYGLFL